MAMRNALHNMDVMLTAVRVHVCVCVYIYICVCVCVCVCVNEVYIEVCIWMGIAGSLR